MFDLQTEWVEVNPGWVWRVFARAREWRQISQHAMKIERVGPHFVAHCCGETHAAPSFRQARIWAEKRQTELAAKHFGQAQFVMNSVIVHCYDCGTEMPLGVKFNPVRHGGKLVLKCPMCHPAGEFLDIASERDIQGGEQ